MTQQDPFASRLNPFEVADRRRQERVRRNNSRAQAGQNLATAAATRELFNPNHPVILLGDNEPSSAVMTALPTNQGITERDLKIFEGLEPGEQGEAPRSSFFRPQLGVIKGNLIRGALGIPGKLLDSSGQNPVIEAARGIEKLGLNDEIAASLHAPDVIEAIAHPSPTVSAASEYVAKTSAPYVTYGFQQAIPGRQELETIIDQKQAEGLSTTDAFRAAWEEVSFGTIHIGPIDIDGTDLIEYGLNPLDWAIFAATGGIGTTVKAARLAAKTPRFSARLLMSVPSAARTGLSGTVAIGKVAPGRIAARIPSLETLEAQAFRGDRKAQFALRLANKPGAKQILGVTNPSAIAPGDVGREAIVLMEQSAAIGANGRDLMIDFVLDAAAGRSVKDLFGLVDNIATAPGADGTPIRLTKFGQGVVQKKKFVSNNSIGDIYERTVFKTDGAIDEAKSLYTNLTREQTAFMQRVRLVVDDAVEMSVEEGIYKTKKEAIEKLGDFGESLFWLSRQAIGRSATDETGEAVEFLFRTGGGLSSKGRPNWLKTRQYEFMAEGVRAGTIYADPIQALEAHLGSVYRVIAERRGWQHVQNSGKMVTTRQALRNLHPQLVAATIESGKLVKATAANLSRIKRKGIVRTTRRTLRSEELKTAEKGALAIERNLGVQENRIADRLLKSQRDLRAALEATSPAAKARRWERYKLSFGEFQEANVSIERLEVEWRRLTRNIERAGDKLGKVEIEAFAVTDDLAQAELEHAIARLAAFQAKTARRQALERIANANDLDVRAFGRTFGSAPKGARVEVGQVSGGGYSNKIVVRDLADSLNRFQSDNGKNILKQIEAFTGTARTLSAGVDVGWPAIQGIGLMLSHPAIWAKATKRSMQAIFSPQLREKYVRENLDDFVSFVEAGGDIGSSEFFQSLDRAGGLGRLQGWLQRKTANQQIPSDALEAWGRHAKPIGRLGTGFNTFLDTAKIEMWKSLRGSVSNGHVNDRELASFINNMLGTLNSRMLGISPTQRQVEGGLLFFSPRFTRSAFALVGNAMGNPGVPGTPAGLVTREAQRQIAGLLLGGTLLMGGIGAALGKEVELNPFKSGWLTMDIAGQNVGIGGAGRALYDMLFKSMAIASGYTDQSPGDLFKFNIFDPDSRRANPLLRYPLNRAAPGVREIITRQTFDGESLDSIPDWVLKGFGPRFLPFALQNYTNPRSGEARPGVVALAFEESGLRARNINIWERVDQMREDLAQDQFGKPWEAAGGEGLSLDEKSQLRRDSSELERLEETARAQTDPVIGQYFDRISRDQQHYNGAIVEASREAVATGDFVTFRQKVRSNDAAKRELREEREDRTGTFQDALGILDENSERDKDLQTTFDRALDTYISQVKANPQFTDEFGNFDFERSERAEEQFKLFLSDDALFLRITNFYTGKDIDGNPRPAEYDGEEQLIKLRQAQAVTEGYWRVPDIILENRPAEQQIWKQFEGTGNASDRALLKSTYPVLTQIERQISQVRKRMRQRDPNLDFALVKYWGHRAIHPQIEDFLRLQSARERAGATA